MKLEVEVQTAGLRRSGGGGLPSAADPPTQAGCRGANKEFRKIHKTLLVTQVKNLRKLRSFVCETQRQFAKN